GAGTAQEGAGGASQEQENHDAENNATATAKNGGVEPKGEDAEKIEHPPDAEPDAIEPPVADDAHWKIAKTQHNEEAVVPPLDAKHEQPASEFLEVGRNAFRQNLHRKVPSGFADSFSEHLDETEVPTLSDAGDGMKRANIVRANMRSELVDELREEFPEMRG
ncbi:unnamed protein product, partial [Amoebophrya sp. A120]